MIMLISFIPVFMLSGREGKLFHPLAFTKSFALIGRGHHLGHGRAGADSRRSSRAVCGREDENWIVRSFINIYKPLLTWALPRGTS